jgi:hypothetical protein
MCALAYPLGVRGVVKNCSLVSVEMDGESKELSKLNFVWEFEE